MNYFGSSDEWRPDFDGMVARIGAASSDLCFRYRQLLHDIEMLHIAKDTAAQELQILRLKESELLSRMRRLSDETPLRIANFISYLPDTQECVVECDDLEMILFMMPTVDRERLMPRAQVLLYGIIEKGSFLPACVVDIFSEELGCGVSILDSSTRPDVTYAYIGGLEQQKLELRELIELPINKRDLMRQLGVEPPRGILLHGPPGCGKTMLVKAVASATSATFIYAVGTEFVKMHCGEGPRKVREVFRQARSLTPSILFIDEIDAVGCRRAENAAGSGEKELQRVLMEFLVQMDGFDRMSDVVVVMATNRPEMLDPALLRPGRLDRKIEFPLPNQRERRLIFQTVLEKVAVASDLDVEPIVQSGRRISGADIQAIVREAAMLAAREQEFLLKNSHLTRAFTKVTDNFSQISFDHYK